MTFALLLAFLLPAQAKKPADPAPVAAAPAIDPAYEANIRKLLDVTGSVALAEQAIDQMVEQMKPLAPQLTPEFWTDARASMKASELVDLLVPIYAKYFTDEDVQALLAFYDTPTGKKFISTQPAVLRDSMAAGSAWGQRIGAEVMTRIEARAKK